LTAIIARHSKPGIIISDHGTQFTCSAVLDWQKPRSNRISSCPARGCRIASSSASMTTASMTRMCDELLTETLLFDIDDACAKLAAWLADFNLKRPQSALIHDA
jgi:putative transposase